MLKVDGKLLKSPSGWSWGLQDVSASDSGRTTDALMHKDRIAQKRKLTLEWQNLEPDEVSTILKAVNPEYVQVRYPDAMSGSDESRTFYVGDRMAPMKIWTISNKRYSLLSFDFIER